MSLPFQHVCRFATTGAATVVGSDRTLTLNVEKMASSLASHGKARNRFFVAHFNAFTRIAIISNLVPCRHICALFT